MRKVIIAGGRDFATNDPRNPRYKYREQDRKYGADCLRPLLTNFECEYRMPHDDLEIVSGGAPGADQFGEDYAVVHWVPCRVFIADWDKHGKSRGTKHMIDTMLKQRKPVHVYFYGEDNA